MPRRHRSWGAHRLREKVLGTEHPKTAVALYNLADLLATPRGLRQRTVAVRAGAGNFRGFEEVLGSENIPTQTEDAAILLFCSSY